jgi:hypothetical protein
MPGGIFSGGMANLSDQGTNAAGSVGTTLTAAGSANTKGSYSQLVASTPGDAIGFLVTLVNPSNGINGFLVDIAIGGAGSEIVLIPNIPFGISNSASAFGAMSLFVPCAIPAGSRVSARCQCSAASGTVTAQVTLLDGNFCELPPCAAPQNYGTSTSTSFGTQIDPGATANTKGSWAQIVASTTYDIAALQMIFDHQGVLTVSNILVDIGVGGAGSEQTLIPNIPFSSNSGGVMIFNPAPSILRTKIPAGSRIAARAQNIKTTSASRKFGLTLLGYPQ